MKLFRFLGLVLILLACTELNATHINSMQVHYEYLGTNAQSQPKYRFRLGAYFDCGGAFTQYNLPFDPNDPPGMGITMDFEYGGGTGCEPVLTQSNWTVDEWEIVTPLCPSVVTQCYTANSPYTGRIYIEAYMDVVFVCSNITTYEYLIGYCCFVDGGVTSGQVQSVNSYVGGEISPLQQNSSPTFPTNQDFTFCEGTPATFDLSVTDPGADSIRYSIFPIVEGLLPSGFVNSVAYNPGYGLNNPLGPAYTFVLDSISGLLAITPSAGAGLEYGFLGLKITEYNAGQTEWTFRFCGFQTVTCGASGFPMVTNQSPGLDSVVLVSGGIQIGNQFGFCKNSPLKINVYASDPDPANALTFFGNFAQQLPGATVVTTKGNPASMQLYWAPGIADTMPIDLELGFHDNFCVENDSVTSVLQLIPIQDVSGFTAMIDSSICGDASGQIQISNPVGLGPFFYQWGNGVTGATLSNLSQGVYPVTVTDIGCGITWNDTVEIVDKDLSLDIVQKKPDCILDDGVLTVVPKGGFAPYSFLWNTGDISQTISPLGPGGFNVFVQDNNGCGATTAFLLEREDSCSVKISGLVFNDKNGNCVRDPGEPPMAYVPMALTDGQIQMSDSGGFFAFKTGLGSVSLSFLPNVNWQASCPPGVWNYNFTSFAQGATGLELPMEMLTSQDLVVTMMVVPEVVVNQTATVVLTVKNKSPFKIFNADLFATYPNGIQLGNIYTTPTSVDVSTQKIHWHIPGLESGENKTFTYEFIPGPTQALGTHLDFVADILPIVGDAYPGTNHKSLTKTVVGSYDPNDKQADPAGITQQGYFTPESDRIEYQIRFQNTGNYPATYVVIRDTLAPSLNLESYEHIESSHFHQLHVEEDSIMVFTFANIGLPDSASAPLGSIGFVKFALGLVPNLKPGTTIRNRAAIYFDFNAPIFTNESLNTVYKAPEVSVWYPLSDPDIHCVGDSLFAQVVNGAGPFHWQWSTGQTTTTNQDLVYIAMQSGSGPVSVTVTDDAGVVVSDTINLNPQEAPKASFVAPPQSQPLQIEFQNTSTNATSFFWDFGDGITSTEESPVHTYQFWGSYQVKLVATSPCGESEYQTLVNVSSTGLDDGLAQRLLGMWVDADRRALVVTFDRSMEAAVSLYDLRGRRLSEASGTGNSVSLTVAEVPRGVYLLEVRHGSARLMKRIVL